MTRYSFKIPCKACETDLQVRFEARKKLKFMLIPMICPTCESTLEIRIAAGLLRRQANVKCTLIKHTDKLLKILDDRRMIAENHAV